MDFMEPQIEQCPDGRWRFIARSDKANDREVEFKLPTGTYVRSYVSIGAHLKNVITNCTMETLEPDGKTWRKGIRAKLSGTVRVRLVDKGDSREIIIHTTKEPHAPPEEPTEDE